MSELEETTLVSIRSSLGKITSFYGCFIQEERGVEGGPPKPRRVGGWGEEKGKRRRDTVEEE